MNPNKTYIFHSDPGHSWLAVKRKELKELGIEKEISQCSYQRGKTVYLEEDCDAPIFYKALESRNITFTYRESYQNNSPIRNYEHYEA